MRLADPAVEFEGKLPEGTALTFQLKSNPKMFQILSDGIYSDKISAVIRELSCNAHDANVMGKSQRPFIVNVPTALESNFWVEDTGLGIDPSKIVDIFWTYGASTKTESNEVIGALGLGSKSPFAYTKSSFLVVNRYSGVEYKYFCFINQLGIPDGKLVYTSETDQPNGVRVELAVRHDDIDAFRERIIRFFSFWQVKDLPTFYGDESVREEIMEIKNDRKVRGGFWEIRGSNDCAVGSNTAYTVMGGVPYPITRRSFATSSKALEAVCSAPINIIFPMGDLNFQVSREELNYDDNTVKALERAADRVCKEVLNQATAMLVGFKTPYSLRAAYVKVANDLQRAFPYVADTLRNQVFKLEDGRTFTANALTNAYLKIEDKSHTPFNLSLVQPQYRVYDKGEQRHALEPMLQVYLHKPEVLDPVTKKRVSSSETNVVSWFKESTAPAPQKAMNRKRTAANYLHDGFKPTQTRFERHVSATDSVLFIVNDIGDRGAEGIRFYAEPYNDDDTNVYYAAKSSGHVYFVDGFLSGKSPDEAEAAFKAFIYGTPLEGAPFALLSKLPEFKLPTIVKADPVKRAPIQRGTIELRLATFHFAQRGAKDYDLTASAGGFVLKFDYCREYGIGYERHELTKPLLYVESNYGAPTDKSLVEPMTLGALHSLGLLDSYLELGPMTKNASSLALKIAYLSPNQIAECERRKVPLIALKSLSSKVESTLLADTAFVNVMQNRINSAGVYDDHARNFNRLATGKFVKHVLPKINPRGRLAQTVLAQNTATKTVEESRRCSAFVYLLNSVFVEHVRLLAGKAKPGELFKTYPLLAMSMQETEAAFEHTALYINAVDEAVDRREAEKRASALAQLHAEALFDLVKG